jgi:histidyl-tRNA synthetase
MYSLPQPIKLYYDITAYRYENVQKGRYREFHQFGVEALGAAGPEIDVEIISILYMFFEKLGLKQTGLNINSIGCPACRKPYLEKLKEYFRPLLNTLCADCNNRFEKNPLRIIDCKNEGCKRFIEGAPLQLDNLCDECRIHFAGLKAGLENLGINYKIDSKIVRGLDYYTRTVFEFVSEKGGSQGTICGGGRYDGLVEMCGGPSVPGIGFALGVERLLMELDIQGVTIEEPQAPDIYIATLGQKAVDLAMDMVYKLRGCGVKAETDLMGRSLKAQMKYADKKRFSYTIVIGDDEIEAGKGVLKDMRTGDQKDVSLDSVVDRLKNQVKERDAAAR